MYKVLKLNEISPLANSVFDKDYTFSDNEKNPDAIMLRSFNMHDYDLPKSVACVGRAGAGVNNIPIQKYAEQGVVVFNTPGANANAVKELVICNMLLSSRKIIDSITWTNSLKGKGEEVPKLVEKGKSQFVGGELTGKKLGVIGLGAIGALVANAAYELGMEVLGYDPFISIDAAWGLNREITKITDINLIFKEADFITLHVPLNDDTKQVIRKENIDKMKDGVKIINCSRGELVCNKDIIAAVGSNKVAKYITDFPCDELLAIENIIAIPHLGASTPEAEDNCAIMAAKEIVDYLENGNVTNSVNYPDAFMPRSTKNRVCVFHKNIKGMITQMTGAISKTANIENMVNKSRGDYAYSMFDICSSTDKQLADTISKIDGVIKVRMI